MKPFAAENDKPIWPTALLVARSEATLTGVRHRVHQFARYWFVQPVVQPVSGSFS